MNSVISLFILIFFSSYNSASSAGKWALEQIQVKINSHSSNIIQLFDTLKYLYETNNFTIDDYFLFDELVEKYQMNLGKYFTTHSSLEILRLLNQQTQDLSLLIIYLGRMGGDISLYKDIDFFVFLASDREIASHGSTCLVRCEYIMDSIEFLIDRIDSLTFSDQPSKDSLEELDILLSVFVKLSDEYDLYTCDPDTDDAEIINFKYSPYVKFWKANLRNFYRFCQLDVQAEIYSVTMDLLFLRDFEESYKIQKIIYLHFLIQKFCIQCSSISEMIAFLISSNDSLLGQNFSPRQIVLILMSLYQEKNWLSMNHFISSFYDNNETSKILVRKLFRYVDGQKASHILRTQDPKDQFKSLRFIKSLQEFCYEEIDSFLS
jgi:hypothetical protein